MVTYSSKFIGKFKIGDNIVYNLKILAHLYHGYSASDKDDRKLLIKPIIIVIGSVAESILYDFNYRAQKFKSEGIAGIIDKTLKAIRHNKQDEFEGLISKFKVHKVLDKNDSPIYNDLDELRKLRNRIHIQNKYEILEPDESVVYTDSRLKKAEKTLEHLIKIMSEKYRRTDMNFVQDFVLPWETYF